MEMSQPAGRPRETRVDDALERAVRALLRERGYRALTVDAVAARAGVGKAAIYRRYATKQELIFAVLIHGLSVSPPRDSGSLQGDLERLAGLVADSLAGSSAEVLSGLLADIHADPALGERFRATYLAAERSVIGSLLDRAVARGELDTRPELEVVHALLLGPLFTWLVMLEGDAARSPELARIVARSVAGALTGGRSGGSGGTVVRSGPRAG